MYTIKPQVKVSIKILCIYFFIWSLPLSTIVLNVVKEREIFNINVLVAFFLGLVINLVWDFALISIQKKEYHKSYL
ncbi:hypothetical protein [Halarcobacter sp.]|uniref:hypothetical protein n=1 Tax=Halarcobacter sp. TaxID=2321133 RepID=UPI002AA838B9|nr:hypothetical protein [Halarcobacter sp.]